MFFNFECSDRGCPKNDILSGLTVALALVPEAVAFAFVAGVEPLVGLYAAFMVGLITAAIGGRPGMISGATGALAVVMVSLVAQHGVEYLFAAVVLMGLIQMLVGFLRLGKFIRMVPHPVMLGFVNGLAIVIFLAQLKSFQIEATEVHVTDSRAYHSSVVHPQTRQVHVAQLRSGQVFALPPGAAAASGRRPLGLLSGRAFAHGRNRA